MNNEELTREINRLRQEVEELKRYVRERKQQQISLPLDEASKTIIRAI